MKSSYFENYIKAVEHPFPEMQEYFDAENEYIAKLCRRDSLVLDVGCGNGRTMKTLAPLVRRIDGIDYSEEMMAAAEKNLSGVPNATLALADIRTMPPSERYDVVFASYNLLGSAETEDAAKILQAILGLTKPGGRTLASVWSKEGIEFARTYYPSIGIMVEKIEDGHVHTDHGIFERFSKSEIASLADKTGEPYSISLITPFFYLLDIQN